MPKTIAQSPTVQPGSRLHWNGARDKNKTEMKNGFHRSVSHSSEVGKAVSAEEFLLHYAEHPDFNYEWNNGILEEKPVADVRNAALYRWLLKLIEAYLEVVCTDSFLLSGDQSFC